MLAVLIELLTGRYIATAYNDRTAAEWPPHPARLFSAMVATWAEGDEGSPQWIQEQLALEWLEAQAPPDILASTREFSAERTALPVFVPVNDVSVVQPPDRRKIQETERLLAEASDERSRSKLTALLAKFQTKYQEDTIRAIAPPAKFGKDAQLGRGVLPEYRGRQERRFPSVSPSHPEFAFVWPDTTASGQVAATLRGLLRRLVRLGHSSSFIRADIASDAQINQLQEHVQVHKADLERGELVIRWVAPGQLNRLCSAFKLHRESEPRVLPATFVRYNDLDEPDDPEPPSSSFSQDFLVFARAHGPRLPSTSCVGLAKLMRRALMAAADQPVHPVISGHEPSGAPSEQAHVAVVPLPAVSGPHPSGSVLGVALILPRDVSDEARRALLRAVGRLEERSSQEELIQLNLGRAGELKLQRLVWSESLHTLRSRTWTRPSHCWATVTPIALDRNPGDLHAADYAKRQRAYLEAEDVLIQALGRIGLPVPEEIVVSRSCVVTGTVKPRAFPRFPAESGRPQRVLVHARFRFKEVVSGPLLVGAGRYHGLGLCLPVQGPGGKW